MGDDGIVIEGEYDLHAQMSGFNAINDSYKLKVVFPKEYPRIIPKVTESANRLPRDSAYHTYKDGSFCLGSEIHLKKILHKNSAITAFFDEILVPFLYSVTYKIKYDIYPNGDLEHGEAGLIDDYERLFNVTGKSSVLKVLEILGKRQRVANKCPCPCGCGVRLGKCDFRFTLIKWRSLDKRVWFRNHLSKSFTPEEKPKRQKYSASSKKKKS